MPHIPVLVEPLLYALHTSTLRFFFDGTLGFAGHALQILQAHPEIETYYGSDQDMQALAFTREKLHAYESKLKLFHANFTAIDTIVNKQSVDGILFDLGVSSFQLDSAERGFSFRFDAPLDMRMNKNQECTAYDIINEYSEEDLRQIFWEYGEEPRGRSIAKAICDERKHKKIETTKQLADLIEAKSGKRSAIHPATRVFQALRIEVNQELRVLKEVLPKAVAALASNGLLCVISFHSLEDRIVKWFFRSLDKEAFEIVTKKPIIADENECRQNPRARSAKLRILKKI